MRSPSGWRVCISNKLQVVPVLMIHRLHTRCVVRVYLDSPTGLLQSTQVEDFVLKKER